MYRLPNTHLTSIPKPTTVFALLCAILLGGSVTAADVQIRELQNIDLGTVPPTVGRIEASNTFCVAMQPRGRYSIIGSGNTPNGVFAITESGTGVHTIRYNVRISDRGNRRGVRLRAGQPLTGLRASRSRPNGRCNPLARMQVIVPAAELAAAHPGRYEGTLTLTVVPE